jgi:hypothetical protein
VALNRLFPCPNTTTPAGRVRHGVPVRVQRARQDGGGAQAAGRRPRGRKAAPPGRGDHHLPLNAHRQKPARGEPRETRRRGERPRLHTLGYAGLCGASHGSMASQNDRRRAARNHPTAMQKLRIVIFGTARQKKCPWTMTDPKHLGTTIDRAVI